MTMSDQSSINLAVSRALNLSKRAGVGWALIDQDKQILHYDACMAGLDAGKLESTIRQFGQQATELFISSEPTSLTFNIEQLIRSIEESNIKTIIIGKGFTGSVANDRWRSWLAGWPGSLAELPYNPIIDKLSLGMQLLQTSQRPWVTSVTAGDFSGHSKPLVNLIQEFDFLNYLANLVKQSRALLVAPTQRDIIDHLPKENYANEPVEVFEIYDQSNISAILKHCVNELRCSLVVLADISLLAHLLKQDLVDEVIHHLANNGDCQQTTDLPPQTAQAVLNLNGWTLLSSSVVGQCGRMIFGKPGAFPAPPFPSGRGLN
jgi:hypothetical protein